MSDPQTELGELITNPNTRRDAVHIAVAPVFASTPLVPGQCIKLERDTINDWAIACDRQDAIGIVDPFLQNEVNQGERFWMFLLPNTITGLNYVWTHPAFEKSKFAYFVPDDIEKSKEWLMTFVKERGLWGDYNDDYAEMYRDAVTAAETFERGTGYDHLTLFGVEAHSEPIPSKFLGPCRNGVGTKNKKSKTASFFMFLLT